MRTTLTTAACLAAVALAGCAAPATDTADEPAAIAQPPAGGKPVAKPPAKPPAGVKVTAYVDGDTIKAGGKTIRLIGIDSPERGECGYTAARDHLRKLVAGKPVVLAAVKGRDNVDRYGRLLRYVAVAGKDLGLAQIAAGYATARYDGRDGYGAHPKQAAYIKADAVAPAKGCTPKPKPQPTQPTTPPKVAEVPTVFANCTEARASGVPLPLRPGDKGWNPDLDRDNDGKACEP